MACDALRGIAVGCDLLWIIEVGCDALWIIEVGCDVLQIIEMGCDASEITEVGCDGVTSPLVDLPRPQKPGRKALYTDNVAWLKDKGDLQACGQLYIKYQ